MSNNVNVFSLNAGSGKEAVKASSKSSVKTVNTKQENFSQTLDQAQQARNRNDASSKADYSKNDADTKDKSLDTKEVRAKDSAESDKVQDDKSTVKNTDKAENGLEATQEEQETQDSSQPATLLAAEAQASLLQEMPMAELNTYFKGDTRLQTVQENVQESVQGQILAGEEALAGGVSQTNKQQDNPLASLQPVEALEQVQKVDGALQLENGRQPVENQKGYAPNDIAALLGSKQVQTVVDEANVYQSQQAKNQQMLNLLAGQQGAYTPQTTVQQGVYVSQMAGQQAPEESVTVAQLSNLTNGLEVVDAEGQPQVNASVLSSQQSMTNGQEQSMTNGQGQQQGSQLPGEASFDVVVPGQQNSKPVEGEQNSSQAMNFQQVLENQTGVVQKVDGNAVQTNQPRETYNVPQQIVEQARLLQRGTDSQMIIKLNPEHLGQLSLKVSVNGNGGVTATFHTDNAQVRAILETTMTQLRQQLNEQGIKVDNVEVQTGLPDGQLPQDQGQQGFYQQQGQQVRSTQADLHDFEESSQNLAADVEDAEQVQEVVLDSQGNQISRGVNYSV